MNHLPRPFTPVPLFLGIILLAGPTFAAPGPSSPSTRGPDRASTGETLARLESLGSRAGETKLWVFFTDKGLRGEAATREALARFRAGLSPHAIARRVKTFGPALGDAADLPVHPSYRADVERSGAAVLRESRWLNAVSIRAPLEAVRAIAELPFVRAITFVHRGHAAPPRFSPTPPEGGAHPRERFDYGPSFDQLDEINVPALHALGFSGAGVIVAMLDTGYERDHPAFARILAEGRLLAQWDFVNDDGETQNEPGDPETQDYHGTATWSVLAGFDEGQLIGPAYGASFLLAKTEDVSSETPIEEDNWVAAMEWADALGADVISSSLSYIDWYTYADMDGDTAISTIGADVAASRGIVVCTAAGNWGTQDWYYIGAPADGDSVVAVGGTMPDGSIWDESSHGPTYDGRIKPEVCARGDGTYGAWPPDGGGPYRFLSGTSVACPLAAGCAALILQVHPDWDAMQVRDALMMTADNANHPDNDRGWGRIDVLAAVGSLAGAGESSDAGASRLAAVPNPSRAGSPVSIQGIAPRAVLPGFAGVYAPGGRRIARIPLGWGDGRVSWDGLDEAGRPAPPGVYFVRISPRTNRPALKLIRLRD